MYCKTQGIKLEYTVPKTPKLNGLAERMNRSLMGMLAHANLPKSYWAEAMLTVVYLINRSPLVPLKGNGTTEGVDRKECVLSALKGVWMLGLCTCC